MSLGKATSIHACYYSMSSKFILEQPKKAKGLSVQWWGGDTMNSIEEAMWEANETETTGKERPREPPRCQSLPPSDFHSRSSTPDKPS